MPKPGPSLSKSPAPGAGGSLFSSSGGFHGKGARSQHLAPGEPTTLTPGATLSRSMGQYGKGHSYLPADAGGATATDPTTHPGVTMIRGGKGNIRATPRQGGLGPKDGGDGTDGSDGMTGI